MVKTVWLTYLTFELNSLLDQGLRIPLKEALEMCEKKTVFLELEKRFRIRKTGLDLSLLDAKTRSEIGDIFSDMAIALGAQDARRKFGVKNNGLCLLIACAQEQIQRERRDYLEAHPKAPL